MQAIKKYGEKLSVALMTTGVYTVTFLVPGAVRAQSEEVEGGIRGAFDDENTQPAGTPDNLLGAEGVFQTVANILLIAIGAIAVIMLIIGGFRYVISGGDSTAIEGAKNTILYAIIGIVVAFLAYAAINFLTGQLTTAESAT